MGKNSIAISKRTVLEKGGMVILPLREYQKLYESAVPTYYLKGKKAKELDRLVDKGLREYERKGTIRASSLREALKIYERRQNKKHRILK